MWVGYAGIIRADPPPPSRLPPPTRQPILHGLILRGRAMAQFWQRQEHVAQRRQPEQLNGGIATLAALADAIRRGRAAGERISPADARAMLSTTLVENSPRYGVDAAGLSHGKGYPDLTQPGELRRQWNPERDIPRAEALLGRKLDANPAQQVQLWEGADERGRKMRDLLYMPAKWSAAMPTEADLNESAGAFVLRALQKQEERRHPSLADMFYGGGWNGGGTVGHEAKVRRVEEAPANAELYQRFGQMLEKGGWDSLYDARDLRVREGQ